MSRSRGKPERNLYDMTPRRLVGSEMGEDGTLVLLRPKFTRGLLARWLQPRLRRPYVRVHLDATGTLVWGLIDGQTTVGRILEKMEEDLGDMDRAEDRLALFLRQLEMAGMIAYEAR